MLNALERALRYQRVHGTRQLLREVLARVRRKLAGVPGAANATAAVVDHLLWVNAIELAKQQAQSCSPLRLFKVPASQPARISLVTDSISRGSLNGGDGTALLLGAL